MYLHVPCKEVLCKTPQNPKSKSTALLGINLIPRNSWLSLKKKKDPQLSKNCVFFEIIYFMSKICGPRNCNIYKYGDIT